MISPNGIAHIQLTACRLATMALLLLLAACADDGYDEHRTLYTVSSRPVQVSDVELSFESCSRPQQCDLIVQISNKSDRCIAFNETDLPDLGHVWLDTTFNLERRITGYPVDRVRRTFVVLQPGDELRLPVDLHAIYDVADLTRSRLTFTTHFFECAAFTGEEAESFELISAPITFTAAP